MESERPPRARRLSPTFFFPPSRVRFSVTRDSGTTCVIRILCVYTHGAFRGNELNSSQEFTDASDSSIHKEHRDVFFTHTREHNRESLYTV